MDESNNRIERPWWVKMGLWGLPTRGSAWAFFWLSLVLAVGCVIYGFTDPRFLWGAGLVFATWWYYASIRWVDQHDRWS